MSLGTPKVRRWLPLFIGMALGIRIVLALILAPHAAQGLGSLQFADSADYDQLARAMLAHQPYEVGGNLASRMPGYPLFVAAVYALCGYSTQAVLIAQALLCGGIVALTYAIARRAGTTVGLLAALLAAFDPLSIGFSETFLSETPFTFLLMLALWLTIRILAGKSPKNPPSLSGTTPTPSAISLPPKTTPPSSHSAFLIAWAALGLIWGAAVYMRASALWCIVPLAALAALAAPSLSRAQRLAAPVIALALLFLTLTPWLIRNYQHFGSGPFRLTTLEGISLYEAVYPDADGGPRQDKISLPPEMVPLNEAQRNDEWSRRAWQYIRADPARILRLAFIKAGRTWSPWFNLTSLRSPPIQAAMILWHVPLFVLGLIGLFAGPLPRIQRIILAVPILYFTLVHSLFLGSIRYRVPLMPIVCILAAGGIVILYKWLFPAQRPGAARV